jgi:hypothetical protein
MRIGDLLARTYTVKADAALPVPVAEAAASDDPTVDAGMNDTAP